MGLLEYLTKVSQLDSGTPPILPFCDLDHSLDNKDGSNLWVARFAPIHGVGHCLHKGSGNGLRSSPDCPVCGVSHNLDKGEGKPFMGSTDRPIRSQHA